MRRSYMSAAMFGAAMAGKLGKLSDYLPSENSDDAPPVGEQASTEL